MITLFDKLFDKAMIQDSGCWEFCGIRNGDGYGQIMIKNKYVGAHRISYELCIADIPKGMQVLHHCDNPPCCNPDHLFVGTHRDNMRDRDLKNRQARPKGILNGRSRLTTIDVKIIKFLLRQGKLSLNQLAREFKVCKSTIVHIKMGRQWSHVT